MLGSRFLLCVFVPPVSAFSFCEAIIVLIIVNNRKNSMIGRGDMGN